MQITRAVPAIPLVLSLLYVGSMSARGAIEDQPTGKAHPAQPTSQPQDQSSTSKTTASTLRMSRAVACRSIDGFEHYEPLGEAGLTSDEKLLVYFRPRGYKVVRRDGEFIVHFSQDGKIRRKGEKAVLRFKRNLLDLETPFKAYPEYIYLRNSVSLKALPPGTYEFDIILRDENAPGQSISQTIEFRIIPVRDASKGEDRPASEDETEKTSENRTTNSRSQAEKVSSDPSG